MPEIAEVARVVHFLRKNLVGKTLAAVNAPDDTNVFGKVGTSGPKFEKALVGKKIIDAGQQGKYFWLIMSSPPHPVFHFGMTGWLHIRGQETYYHKRSNKAEEPGEDWPPRFWKFTMETTAPKVEAAFTDARRFARIRLVDCAGKYIRNTTPLKENGPDPVIDKDVLTFEWLQALLKRKNVPIKALLLDQANISGIGNWVGDEIMFHARLHPEQYSSTFSDTQLRQLHTSILHVCGIAVGKLADSSQFPDDWLFNHRWGKGKKDASTTLPTGEKITFLTVGGRTSCVVPELQKKTGPVAGEVTKKDVAIGKVPKKRKASEVKHESEEATKSTSEAVENVLEPTPKSKKSRSIKQEEESRSLKKSKVKAHETFAKSPPKDESNLGRRRSARRSTAGS